LFRLSPFICLDPVTTTIWLVSFDLIILSILHRTMGYVSSVHDNLDSHYILSNSFPNSINFDWHGRIFAPRRCQPVPGVGAF
jgi:hypothetical protein